MNFARANLYAAAYTNKSPSRDQELVELVKWARDQPGRDLLLVGPMADALRNTDLGAELVGRKLATCKSAKTYNSRGADGADRVIALWPDPDTVASIEDQPSLEALGVLMWGFDETIEWARGVGATDVLTGERADPVTILDPTALGAFRTITNSANLSTGLSHPSDWDTAIVNLRYLRSHGHDMQGGDAASWALANGWAHRHAREFGRLVLEIESGRTKRLKSGREWKPNPHILRKSARIPTGRPSSAPCATPRRRLATRASAAPCQYRSAARGSRRGVISSIMIAAVAVGRTNRLADVSCRQERQREGAPTLALAHERRDQYARPRPASAPDRASACSD